MRSTMMRMPLLISQFLEHGRTAYASSVVSTWSESGAQHVNYAQIGDWAAQAGHALRELGVTGDQRVGTLLWNNPVHLTAYLAVPSMGAVLHTLNPRLPAEELGYIVNHAEDHVLLVNASLAAQAAAILPTLTTVRHVILADAVAPMSEAELPGSASSRATPDPLELLADAATANRITVHRWDDLLAGRPRQYPWPDLDEDDAAALCYTSGTTGRPRGVAYSHRSTWLHAMQVGSPEALDVRPDGRCLIVVPMFHAMAWGLPYAAFRCGSAMVLPDRFGQAGPLAAMIGAERPTMAAAVPTVWIDLLSHLEQAGGDISALREVIVGGAACPPSLMHAFADRHRLRLVHAWGMTEMSPLGSVARPPVGVTGELAWRYRYSQGQVPAGVQARIVGLDGIVLPADGSSVGELEVRGPWVTARYLGQASDDPDAFRDGWLRTGDVGTLSADRFITLTDRVKDLIKSGGEWISSVVLESALLGHPDVRSACVIGTPDPRWGERPLAAVELHDGGKVGADQLADFLAQVVPSWQVPRRWAFLPVIPRTGVGKIDKKLVRAWHADGSLPIVESTT